MEKTVWGLVWNGKSKRDINRRAALLPISEGGRNCQDLGLIRSASAIVQVTRMDRHPELPWVYLAVNLMAEYTCRNGQTKHLVVSTYTEPWKQHSSRNRVRMPPSMNYICERWWKHCPHRRHHTSTELICFVEPNTATEVLQTKFWYYLDLEELRENQFTVQRAKVWSSAVWCYHM